MQLPDTEHQADAEDRHERVEHCDQKYTRAVPGVQQPRQGDGEAEVQEYIEVIRVAPHYVIDILVHVRAQDAQGVQARQRGVEAEEYEVAHVLAEHAGTQEEAVVVHEVEALAAVGAVLRRLAHVAPAPLAVPELVGSVVRRRRWRRLRAAVRGLLLELLALLLLLMMMMMMGGGDHAA